MRVIDCEQGTPEWFAARTGVITASRFKDACSVLKSGEPAQASRDYAMELVFERLTNDMAPKVVNMAMTRGSDLEPQAADIYSEHFGVFLEKIGFVKHDTLPIGCSPDRLVDNDGLIEIKCPFDIKRVMQMWATKDASEYMHQIQGQLWLTGRRWCDLVVYDPRLANARMDLFVKRVWRDEVFIANMEKQLVAFLEYVDVLMKQIKGEQQ